MLTACGSEPTQRIIKVDDSLSDGGEFIVSCSSCSSRRGGLEPVQHPGHGGDRAEQADERPGLRGHPEAAHLRRWPRAEGHHAATPETLAGRDPEETGCCSREEEGVWSAGVSHKSGQQQSTDCSCLIEESQLSQQLSEATLTMLQAKRQHQRWFHTTMKETCMSVQRQS